MQELDKATSGSQLAFIQGLTRIWNQNVKLLVVTFTGNGTVFIDLLRPLTQGCHFELS